MKLSEKITFLRKQHGLSQEQLSYKLNISRQAIYRWESGATKPDVDNIKLLSEMFNVPYNELLDDEIDISNLLKQEPEHKTSNSRLFLTTGIILIAILLSITVTLSIALITKSTNHEHSFGEFQVTKLPTCTSAGLEARFCTNCNFSETRQLPYISHSETVINGYPANCTSTGLTDGKKCSICGIITKEQIAIPIDKTSHSLVTIEEIPATCTKTGMSFGTKCSLCDTILVNPVVTNINENNHTSIILSKVEPTCINEGLTEGISCKDCNKVLQAQTIISKTSHSPEIFKGFSPTCTSDGLTDGTRCSICKITIAERQTITHTGHIIEKIKGYPATCKSTGLTDGTKCKVCKTTLSEQIIIETLPHTETTILGYEPTCISKGMTNGSYCTQCGTAIIEQLEIPATKNHCSNNNYVYIEGTHVLATCLSNESITIKCTLDSNCTYTTTKILSPALNHAWEINTDKMLNGYPICSTGGNIPYICKRINNGVMCNSVAYNVNGETKTSYLHTYVEGDFSVAPTCISRGKYNCTSCGNEFIGYTFDNSSNPTGTHDCSPNSNNTINIVEPTCVSNGYTEYKCILDEHCSYSETVLSTKKGFHELSSVNRKILTCKTCNKHYEVSDVYNNAEIDVSIKEIPFCLCGDCGDVIECGGTTSSYSITPKGKNLTFGETTVFDFSSNNIENGFIWLENINCEITAYNSNGDIIQGEFIDNYYVFFDCSDIAKVEVFSLSCSYACFFSEYN